MNERVAIEKTSTAKAARQSANEDKRIFFGLTQEFTSKTRFVTPFTYTEQPIRSLAAKPARPTATTAPPATTGIPHCPTVRSPHHARQAMNPERKLAHHRRARTTPATCGSVEAVWNSRSLGTTVGSRPAGSSKKARERCARGWCSVVMATCSWRVSYMDVVDRGLKSEATWQNWTLRTSG
jgi:hypothetical protein